MGCISFLCLFPTLNHTIINYTIHNVTTWPKWCCQSTWLGWGESAWFQLSQSGAFSWVWQDVHGGKSKVHIYLSSETEGSKCVRIWCFSAGKCSINFADWRSMNLIRHLFTSCHLPKEWSAHWSKPNRLTPKNTAEPSAVPQTALDHHRHKIQTASETSNHTIL